MLHDLLDATPFLRPFPDPATVFADPVERYARHLRPLCSIDLRQVDPAWRGWIHLLSPFEPDDGYIGAHTQAHHNRFLRVNWLAFKLVDGRYTLPGDWRYFAFDSPETPAHRQRGLEDWHADEQAAFDQVRAHYQAHGRLHPWRCGYQNLREPVSLTLIRQRREIRGFELDQPPLPLLDQLGGEMEGGNWSGGDDWPLDRSDPDHPVPLTADGRRLRFVARVAGTNYGLAGADSILLFYDPLESVALFTFDYT